MPRPSIEEIKLFPRWITTFNRLYDPLPMYISDNDKRTGYVLLEELADKTQAQINAIIWSASYDRKVAKFDPEYAMTKELAYYTEAEFKTMLFISMRSLLIGAK